MNNLAIIQVKEWINPEIIPGFPIRWYGLMYIVAFFVTWLLMKYEAKFRYKELNSDNLSGVFIAAAIGLIVGARIFGTLVYGGEYYLTKPWMIFFPFDGKTFVGFQGMSYHGGFLGLIVGTLIYCKWKKINWLRIADLISLSAPLGYTAGRIGNFINGELWGRVSTAPWAIVFPTVPESERFPASQDWVQKIAEAVKIPIGSPNDLINLPRHPSQLYEALFEGIVLWLILWLFFRRPIRFSGFATAIYAIGYGTFRFIIEYFRQPDSNLGFIIAFNPNQAFYLTGSPLNFTLGQIFCAMMIITGIIIIIIRRNRAATKLKIET